MGGLGVDANVYLTSRRRQASRHDQVVLEHDVPASDDEQSGGQAAQVAVDGRDVGICAVGEVARVCLNEVLAGEQPAGGCLSAHVVGPVLQRCPGEGGGQPS